MYQQCSPELDTLKSSHTMPEVYKHQNASKLPTESAKQKTNKKNTNQKHDCWTQLPRLEHCMYVCVGIHLMLMVMQKCTLTVTASHFIQTIHTGILSSFRVVELFLFPLHLPATLNLKTQHTLGRGTQSAHLHELSKMGNNTWTHLGFLPNVLSKIQYLGYMLMGLQSKHNILFLLYNTLP